MERPALLSGDDGGLLDLLEQQGGCLMRLRCLIASCHWIGRACVLLEQQGRCSRPRCHPRAYHWGDAGVPVLPEQQQSCCSAGQKEGGRCELFPSGNIVARVTVTVYVPLHPYPLLLGFYLSSLL